MGAWMIQEIRARGLEDTVYLWSDDNLSTDYFWRYLSTNDNDLVRDAKNYGRVCCFKGFDEASFSFNTLADESLFQRQFDLFRRFVDIGIDLYAYVTLTSPTSDRIVDRVRRFVDRLQTVHQNLPLRTVLWKFKCLRRCTAGSNRNSGRLSKFSRWPSNRGAERSKTGTPWTSGPHRSPLCR